MTTPSADRFLALQCCLKALRACQRGRDRGMKPFTLRAIQSRERWLRQQQRLMDELPELRGCDLVCWFAPLPCHGDVLLELANER